MKRNKRKKGFSKKLLIADYIIAVMLVVAFIVCSCINGNYIMDVTDKLIEMGMDVSTMTITPPFDLNVFGIFISTWIVQLGVSSGAYYVLVKTEHKIELPIQLLNGLPSDIKEQVDLTQVITSVLSCTDS